MPQPSAQKKLAAAIRKNRSLLCVGLDTDPQKVPRALRKHRDPVAAFNQRIISATQDLVCAYKLNIAFYEAEGPKGLRSLEKTLARIPPQIVSIIDGKRGDIGNTSHLYARSLYEYYGADAATVHPYMGTDSLAPFLAYRNKITFILCLTSNPSAREFQQKPAGNPLYISVARKARQWYSSRRNCGLVIGATQPAALKKVRQVCPDQFFLVPGVGAQAGNLKKVLANGLTQAGTGLVINSSRSIIYASSGSNFDGAARNKAQQVCRQINNCINFL